MSQPCYPIAPGIWAAQSEVFMTNSGVFASRGAACLVDPGVLPGEIEVLSAFVLQQGARPQALVLTHSHYDHILGPQHFPGVEVIAHANYLAEVSAPYEAHILKQVQEMEAAYGATRDRPFIIPRPTLTFGKELVLAVGDLSLRLIHAPGHAADQLVVYEPASATLWAADMLSDLEIPFVSHSLCAYERTLAHLSALDVRRLVPGHGHATAGPVEIAARFSEDIAYLGELRERVGRAVEEGRSVEEALRLCADPPYRFPEENARQHRLNVESVYLELGGAGNPAQIGWNQLPTTGE